MMTSLNSTRVQAPASVSDTPTPPSPVLYDGVSLNPSGRGTADVTGRGDVNNLSLSGLLRPKKSITVATFNVRTLSSDCKVQELVANAEQYNIDVICLQEHRHYHEEVDIRYQNIGKWTLITSSATKNSINATIGGVGFLVSPKAKAALNYVSKVSSRIIMASFNSNPALTTISCYSPTNCSDVDDVEAFYEDLTDTVSNLPKHNMLLIGGDFNAQLGRQDHRFSFHPQTNRNGAFLDSILTQFNLQATNTLFQKRRGKLWTINYGNGSRGQIDFILVNRKWLNSITNCEAYSSFESVNSDHRIVSANIRLSVRAHKPKRRTNIFCWEALRTDNNVHSQFSVSVKNRYESLCSEVNLDEPHNNSGCYKKMIQACKEAAEETIPKRPVNKTALPWEDSDIAAGRNKVKELAAVKRRTKNAADKANFSDAIKDLDALYLQKQASYVEGKIDEINAAHHQRRSKTVWKVVNEVTGRKKSDSGRLKALNPSDRISTWKNHFATLLGATSTSTTRAPVSTVIQDELPINTDDFTLDELRCCIKSLKNNKACGLDDIPAEVWKAQILDQELLGFCNKTLNGDKPEIWSASGIIPIPKTGDLSDPANYRGISLTPIAAKVYNTLILNRIQPHIDPLLRPNQNGFRKGRGTTSQILTIRRIIEGVKSKSLKSVLTFVDFKKAFDSIDRSMLMDILRAYGIPEKIVRAINIMYTDTIAKVLSSDGETDFFKILAGVLQGDTLAPFLFIIVVDYVMRSSVDGYEDLGLTITEGRTTRLPRKANKSTQECVRFTDSGYADDLCLVSDTLAEAQTLLGRLETAASDVGLIMNEKKTEYMSFNQPGSHLSLKSLAGKELKKVDDFKYLGSWINTTERDLKVRIAKAWAASNKLDKIWKSSLSRELKIHFFRATVETVLLYGAECWTLTKQQQKRVDGCYTRLLRASLNVSWKQRMTNKVLYGDIPPISHTIRERRLRFAGHCYRAKEECVSSVLMWKPQHGKRRVGRPAKTYLDLIEEDTGLKGEDLEAVMADRDVWRIVIRSRPQMSP